ncbi:hypothetical protein AFM12_04815 [Jiulongibacter sediminis]|uniref:Uncharacterized protein n=1 Tax=Jiulongibacter sediminis TaxID=1605367 RepID=A0A0P7CAY8_9BACT|nr:hypothetical protein AFM12_04815 [Jiulongibacter sediminis]TBX26931.1 hypothetical protein TK44_04820 [Jiulongibacter sediminis]
MFFFIFALRKLLLDLNRTEKKIALNKQISDFSDELKEKAGDFKILGRDLLIIGGILTAGFALSKMFDEDEPETRTEERIQPGDSIFASAFKGAATSILLAVAKQKLSNYLESLDEDDE